MTACQRCQPAPCSPRLTSGVASRGQHYLEGELQIDNVTIEGNSFLCEAGGACMQDFTNGGKGEGGFCTGYLGPGSQEYWNG